MNTTPKFKLGDLVCKTKGSKWSGTVVGTYSTALTPEGYAVESGTEKGSVQIYPAAALEVIKPASGEAAKSGWMKQPTHEGTYKYRGHAFQGGTVGMVYRQNGELRASVHGLDKSVGAFDGEWLELVPAVEVKAHSEALVDVALCAARLKAENNLFKIKVELADAMAEALRVASCLGAYTAEYVRQEANAALDAWNQVNK